MQGCERTRTLAAKPDSNTYFNGNRFFESLPDTVDIGAISNHQLHQLFLTLRHGVAASFHVARRYGIARQPLPASTSRISSMTALREL
jgi:hypothetical protein